MEELIFKYIGEKNFRGYTMTGEDLQMVALKIVAIILAVFMWSLLILRPEKHEKQERERRVKQLAWVISLLNSFVMSVAGVIYAIIILPKIVAPLLNFELDPQMVFHAPMTNFSMVQAMWFGIANILDLTLGTLFYPKYLHILTAWVHHTVFIWLMYAASTGDTLFYKTRPFYSGFAIVAIEEIPTFLLALGSIFPMLRTDLGFGFTFFLLRIVYHGLFFISAFYYIHEIEPAVAFMFAATLLLHLHWFSTWQAKYGFVAKPRKPQGVQWTPPEKAAKSD
jgi:hypothetical protein